MSVHDELLLHSYKVKTLFDCKNSLGPIAAASTLLDNRRPSLRPFARYMGMKLFGAIIVPSPSLTTSPQSGQVQGRVAKCRAKSNRTFSALGRHRPNCSERGRHRPKFVRYRPRISRTAGPSWLYRIWPSSEASKPGRSWAKCCPCWANLGQAWA